MAPSGGDSSLEEEEIWGLLAGSAIETEEPATVLAPYNATVPGQAATACYEPTSLVQASSAPSASQIQPAFKSKASIGHKIPIEILEDAALNLAIAQRLPRTHDFEVHRTVWKLRRAGARHVGLQLPEGLQGWATGLADILSSFVPSVESTTIMGDVTFGACCIDDLGACALGVDYLVHYGHSCIVPTDQTTVVTHYVHVEVEVDVEHLVDTVLHNFGPEKCLALLGSVQFTSGMLQTREELKRLAREAGDDVDGGRGASKIPQVRPLSSGETLGCTSPHVGKDVDAVIFVCDGRFHLESAMIQNPHLQGNFFRYDPAALTLTREGFAHNELHKSRRQAIADAKRAKLVGLILGTLGRQGSVGVLEEVERLLEKRGIAHLTILLSEISPERLALMPDVDAWVQVACPRLSMDWGNSYSVPMLSSYEAHVAFGEQAYKDVYPMDYYSNKGGPWANYGAHGGHGGSVSHKFRHLSLKSKRHLPVGYEDEDLKA
eukprot:TRINITY_DN72260_c0_g1_i1.p1 TRINITY_DN72260_c0_g1~~TRINITY_DN72260_c0_g1_i1.p1  ORF type:complete len:499 (+),score=81.92 TRINITY_DN72260_c0_g1_i1:26-1498(+)